jgi:hypothetical protein
MKKFVVGSIALVLYILGWGISGFGEPVPAPRGELRIVDTHPNERVGSHSSCQSEVGRVIQSGGATRRAPRPEKTDRPCEGRSG